VEFQSPQEICRKHPNRVRNLSDGGTWGTLAGQPTDDSEMALMLARMLVKHRRYDSEEARKAYLFWYNSAPFDCGGTVSCGLRGTPDTDLRRQLRAFKPREFHGPSYVQYFP
jgi:ADP-ribosyl-[dinitrogen reductase] hydrolase